MIKHQNKIIAQKALGRRGKNINGELRSTVAKQEAITALQQKEFHEVLLLWFKGAGD